MELPLTARELMRLTRRRGFYWTRMLAPAWSAALMTAFALSPTVVPPDTVGRACYTAALIAQYFTIYAVIPTALADAIAREKEDRTLQILLLANPRAQDVILSKYSAPMLFGALLIAGTLPMMAFAGFFGAVPPAQATAQTVMSLFVAAAVGAVTMLASVVSARPRHALWVALMMIAALLLIAEALGRALPQAHLSLWRRVTLDDATAALRALWPSLTFMAGVTLAVLAGCVAILPLQIHEARAWRWFERRRGRRQPRISGNSVQQPLYELLRGSSWVDSAWERPGIREIMWLCVIAICLLFGPVSWLALTPLVAYQTHATVKQLAQTGALDDLRLATPDGRSLADALFHRQFRAHLYVVPAFVAGGVRQFNNAPPWVFVVILAAVAAIAVAVVRYAVGYACSHWWNATSGRAALAVLMRVLIRLLTSLFIVFAMSLIGGCFTAWFQFPIVGRLYGIVLVGTLCALLAGVLTGDARDERLRFIQHLEGELLRAG